MSSSISLSVVCLSVVCNVGATYSDDCNFRQCFYAVWYVGHLLYFEVKFYGDRPRGTPPLGVLNRRGEAKYRDFGPLQDYISEMVQDRR